MRSAEVADEAALLKAVGLGGAQVVSVDPNWAEQVVRFLTNPLVSPLLLSLGLLGLVLEIKSGAFGLGGLVSLASLGLFFGSSFLLGLAGWEEVLLLGLGLVALASKSFVLPGFGVAGILGITAVAAAMVLAMMGATPTGGDVAQALAVLGAGLVITAAVVLRLAAPHPQQRSLGGLFLRGGMTPVRGIHLRAPRSRPGGAGRSRGHRSQSGGHRHDRRRAGGRGDRR